MELLYFEFNDLLHFAVYVSNKLAYKTTRHRLKKKRKNNDY